MHALITILFFTLPLLFVRGLCRRTLACAPEDAGEAFAHCARSYKGCTLVFWMAWLAWYYHVDSLARQNDIMEWFGAYRDLARAVPALLVGTAVTLAMRFLVFPVYARQADGSLQRTAFVMQAFWFCCLIAVVWMLGGEVLRSLGHPVRALAFGMAGAGLFYGFGRLLFSALGLVSHALDTGELRDRVDALARAAGIYPLRGFYLVQTTQMPILNAFASTSGRLYLTEPLVRHLTKREVDAVVAHELTHLKQRHPVRYWRLMALMALAGAVVGVGIHGAVTYFRTGMPIWPPHFDEGTRGYLLCMGGMMCGILLALGRSRAFENEADEGCVVLTGDAEAMISALVTLSRMNGQSRTSRKKRKRRLSGHPSLSKRAEYIAATGGVPPDRVEALLGGVVVGDGHYSIPGNGVPVEVASGEQRAGVE